MRTSGYILLFLVFLEAGAGMVQMAGIADTHDINTEPGDTSQLNDARDDADDTGGAGGGAIGGTLVGLIAAGSGILSSIFGAVFSAPTILKNLMGGGEVVTYLIDYLFAGLVFIVAFDVLAFLRPGGVD